MPSYLVCELNSTSKIMRTFFFSSSFCKSRTSVLFPCHGLPGIESQFLHLLASAETARNRLRRLLWERKPASRSLVAEGGLGTQAGGSACQERTRQAGSATEAPQHASSVQHVASLRPACLPHMPLMPCPHLASLHNSFAEFMPDIWGLPARGPGTLFRAISFH